MHAVHFWWGDLYIINDVGESLVFLGGDKNAEEEHRRGDADSSPTSTGTQKLAALTIEAKEETVHLPSKKYQLWHYFVGMEVCLPKN